MSVATQPLAVLFAIAGSGSYAIAAVTQQHAAARLQSKRAFDPAVLARLIRQPVWLAGLLAVAGGFILQAAALGLGRLVVIEPMLASGLLFALLLAAHRDHRRLTRAELAAVLAVVCGLAVFLVAGQPHGGQREASVGVLGLAAAGALCLIGICALVAGRLARSHRAVLLGLGGGTAAGVTDALIKSVTVVIAGHRIGVFGDVRLYLLAAVGLTTYTVQQNGYRAAGLAQFLPSFAVMEPITGSVIGLLIYRERLNGGIGQIALELLACGVTAWGIVRLATSDAEALVIVPAVPAPRTETVLRTEHGPRTDQQPGTGQVPPAGLVSQEDQAAEVSPLATTGSAEA